MTDLDYNYIVAKCKGLDIVNVSVHFEDLDPTRYVCFHQYDRIEYLKDEPGRLVKFDIASYENDPWLKDKYSLSVHLRRTINEDGTIRKE